MAIRRTALIWRLFPAYFLITLISVLALGSYALSMLGEFYYSHTERDMLMQARLIRQVIASAHILGRSPSQMESEIRAIGRASSTRVTLISTRGAVMADSNRDPSSMQNHSDRPEFRQAMLGEVGTSRRRSPTLGYTMIYVAVPITDRGTIRAVLRVSRPATAIDSAPRAVYRHIALATALTALLAGLVSFIAARIISRPISTLRAAAARFASGDLKTRATVPDTEELGGLAETLNDMASRLDQQVRAAEQQSRERQAILASMQEGVIAIGSDDRILMMNPMAEQMLGVSADAANGKAIQEVIRNSKVQQFVNRSRASEEPTVEEMTLRTGADERIVHLTGTALVDADNRKIGALVVLNDITKTRKLENLRRDFVANVSHELKTPITSIKGFVETLREGALDDRAKAKEFLGIIARQADRLNAIIEDLLALSAIEQKAESDTIPLQPTSVRAAMNAAVESLKHKAGDAGIEIVTESRTECMVYANQPLLEQAISNLLDNAIKYSPSGSTVRLAAEQTESEIAVHVTDNGPGIEAEHLPRLFERFYRVDKARSRKMGGTGLGLAIAKHIVQAHHGRIEVRSTPGQGSTFSIYLPLAPQADQPTEPAC